ncbi:5799_t:CDS:2, partial [Funneliformis caledonium]
YNATPLDKAKYKLCKDILNYEQDNGLTTKDIAQQLGLTKLPQKPTNLRPYAIDIIINKKRFTRLELNPLIATLKHPNENITDDLIIYLIEQLNGETVKPEPKRYYQ